MSAAATTLIRTGGQLRVNQKSFVTFTLEGMAVHIYNHVQLVAQMVKSGAVVQDSSAPFGLGKLLSGAGNSFSGM